MTSRVFASRRRVAIGLVAFLSVGAFASRAAAIDVEILPDLIYGHKDGLAMTLDVLKTRVTAILPGASFQMDDLGQIVIRSSSRLRLDPEALAQTLRDQALYRAPRKKGLFRRRK